MRHSALFVVVLACVGSLVGCATLPPELVPAPRPISAEPLEFRSIWVAGFVAPERRDFDVNAAVVEQVRTALRTQTTARVLSETPLRLTEEGQIFTSERYAPLVGEYSPLVVTGTIRYDYPTRRPTYRAGRRADVHETVSLDVRLVLIDGRSGDVIAVKTLPSKHVAVAHGRPSVSDAFDQLYDRASSELLQVVTGGTGPARWTLR